MQRRTLLSLTAGALAGCSLAPLAPLPRQPLGAQTPGPQWREPTLGQSWTYRVLNMYNGQEVDTVEDTLASLWPQRVIRRRSSRHGDLPDEVQSRWGQILQDPAWDRTQVYAQALPLWPERLQPGEQASASTHYQPLGASYRQWIAVQMRALGFERIEVNGVWHDTLQVQRLIRLDHEDSSRLNYTRTDRLWLSPQAGRWVVRETNGEYWRGGQQPSLVREDHWRWVLMA